MDTRRSRSSQLFQLSLPPAEPISRISSAWGLKALVSKKGFGVFVSASSLSTRITVVELGDDIHRWQKTSLKARLLVQTRNLGKPEVSTLQEMPGGAESEREQHP